MTPWESRWWPELVACAVRGGATGADIIEKVAKGHSIGFPVRDLAFLVLDRAEDDALVIWLGVGRDARSWISEAEAALVDFARQIGCTRLRIEGRKGWRRLLPHWTQIGEDLELPV